MLISMHIVSVHVLIAQSVQGILYMLDNVSLPNSDRGIWIWLARVTGARPAPHWFGWRVLRALDSLLFGLVGACYGR